jgi:hypothetical protein
MHDTSAERTSSMLHPLIFQACYFKGHMPPFTPTDYVLTCGLVKCTFRDGWTDRLAASHVAQAAGPAVDNHSYVDLSKFATV